MIRELKLGGNHSTAQCQNVPSCRDEDPAENPGRWRAHSVLCALGLACYYRRASPRRYPLGVSAELQRGSKCARTVVSPQHLPLHIEDGVNDLLLLARHGKDSLLASSGRMLA